jgi:hypothetical protein
MELVDEKELTILQLEFRLWMSTSSLFLGFPSTNELYWKLMIKKNGPQEALGDFVDQRLNFCPIVPITIWSTGSQKSILRNLPIWRVLDELLNFRRLKPKSLCEYSHLIQYHRLHQLTIRLCHTIFLLWLFG